MLLRRTSKRALHFSLPAALLLLTACGSCIIGASRNTTAEDATSAPESKKEVSAAAATEASDTAPVVHEDLVKALETFVLEKGKAEGYGLFSEGGFSGIGSGQYMILVTEDGKWTVWQSPAGNAPKSSAEFKEVTPQKAKEFAEASPKFAQLASTKATAYDAFSYSYVHIKKSGSQTTRAKVLNIQNLLSDKAESKPYNEVLATFKTTTSN